MKTDSSKKDILRLKKSIRSAIQINRDGLDEEERYKKSLAISRKFMELEYYLKSRKLLAYYPFRSEIDTRIIIKEALTAGKEVALPRVRKDGLDLYYVKDLLEDLEPGSYNIMEPIPSECEPASPGDIDLVVVPGVGFDHDHNRLGYGGGFYDRLLARVPQKVPRIALAFDLQIIDSIPVSDHDLKIDILITETLIY